MQKKLIENVKERLYNSMEGQSGQKEYFLILINDLLIVINDFLVLINHSIY